jgi:hypothetical protein
LGFFSQQISFKISIYTVLKKRLWESRSTPTLVGKLFSNQGNPLF